MLKTLVHNKSIHKGSLWGVYVPTVVFLYDYEGPLAYDGVVGADT